MSTQASAVIDFSKGGGLIPVITVDHQTHRVLMFAYMNREAFDETVATGRACYFSSGNFQTVREIRTDCDADTILLAVEQHGDAAACHEGYESCFFRKLDHDEWRVVDQRKVDPSKYGPGYGHQQKTAG
jgi:phosphoribosyl-AMP cyclohydrolase